MTTTTPSAPDEVVLPCPFCGNAPHVQDYREREDHTGETYGYAAVECTCIGSHGGLFFHFDTLAEAKAAWNRRASPQPAGVTEEQVEAAIRGFFGSEHPHHETLSEGIKEHVRRSMRAAIEAARLPSPTDTRERVPAPPVFPHGMTEAEWNEKIGDPSYEHAKDLPDD